MGRKSTDGQRTVPVTLDSQGRVKYEALLGHGDRQIIQARHEDVSEKKFSTDELRKPDAEEEAATTEATKKALEKVLNGKIVASKATAVEATNSDNKEPTYVRYTPSQQIGNVKTRIIRVSSMQSDPLEPPKFKNKKAPRGPGSPPVPVMHSPPRKVTVKDQQDWKIPPCISNWKNNKGYTIGLDKRLAADGRGLQETIINDNFAKLSESLYIAERVAREEVAKRAEIEKRIKLKEKEKKEDMLRKLAQEARMERATSQVTEEEEVEEEGGDNGRRERDQIRYQRQKERERELRLQRNKSMASRNEERDISERVALGMAAPQANSETMYDQRLFNQSQGLDSGFGDEEGYTIYNKPLFQASSANQLYRPKKDLDTETYGGEEDFNKLLDTSKFKPDKDFTGADREKSTSGQQSRNKPVEFEKVEEDPFGLDEFLSAAKTGSKALDKIGKSGTMHASAGNASSSTGSASNVQQLTKRKQLDFERSGSNKKQR